MDKKYLASLRKGFEEVRKSHDGPEFRFIVEMLFHYEELEPSDFNGSIWSGAQRAVSILNYANADFDAVYAWSHRGPFNSQEKHEEMAQKYLRE